MNQLEEEMIKQGMNQTQAPNQQMGGIANSVGSQLTSNLIKQQQ